MITCKPTQQACRRPDMTALCDSGCCDSLDSPADFSSRLTWNVTLPLCTPPGSFTVILYLSTLKFFHLYQSPVSLMSLAVYNRLTINDLYAFALQPEHWILKLLSDPVCVRVNTFYCSSTVTLIPLWAADSQFIMLKGIFKYRADTGDHIPLQWELDLVQV